MTMTALVSHAGIVALSLVCTGVVSAQAPAGGQPPTPVQVMTTKFGANFYAIDGQGGRMGALIGPDGVFLVDAQFPAVTDRIVAALRQIAPDARLRFLVNTHVHGDHTGGNENFAKLGVTLMSRPLLRMRLQKPAPPAPGGKPTPPAPAAALATVTYDERTTLYMNGDEIQLIPLRDAHTDGDTAVRFVGANVLMTGDVFRSIGYPNIDRNNGGTLKGMLASLSLLVDTAEANTTVVPGHGDITNRAAIIAHRDMAMMVRDRVSKLLSEGRTMEQAVAAKPTADFDQRVGNAAQSADRFVQQVYAELRGPAPR